MAGASLSQSHDVSTDDPVVGCVGKVITATRGVDGPGEVLVKVRGGTEAYLAYSEEPLAPGSEVLVFNCRGHRSVDVMQFGSGETDPLT